ncbi:hypothetical protein NPIL_681821 [Nephila pilipes]|uniref:Granulins domain-containing protein n=1 Tax=Nephila pilipes TaxID=299642 RepID=A0A8X6U7M8_NEPPI|nr:hypothetical protein NPIL_681821 [Nephila pilipes]
MAQFSLTFRYGDMLSNVYRLCRVVITYFDFLFIPGRFAFQKRSMYVLVTLVAFLCSLSGVFSECEPGYCAPDQTCCPGSKTGEWTCCAYPNAACCKDMEHCCPEGQVCSPDSRTCYPKMLPTVRYSLKKRVLEERDFDFDYGTQPIQLCNRSTTCYNSSCCRTESENEFACCDYLGGICCPGGTHCCHPDEKCSESSLECIGKDGSVSDSLPLRDTYPRFPFRMPDIYYATY